MIILCEVKLGFSLNAFQLVGKHEEINLGNVITAEIYSMQERNSSMIIMRLLTGEREFNRMVIGRLVPDVGNYAEFGHNPRSVKGIAKDLLDKFSATWKGGPNFIGYLCCIGEDYGIDNDRSIKFKKDSPVVKLFEAMGFNVKVDNLYETLRYTGSIDEPVADENDIGKAIDTLTFQGYTLADNEPLALDDMPDNVNRSLDDLVEDMHKAAQQGGIAYPKTPDSNVFRDYFNSEEWEEHD